MSANSAHKHRLRLKLAARTLLELGTPPTSTDYKRILGDLIALHPRAKRWGLARDTDLLKVDREGTILWFLATTLDDASRPREVELSPQSLVKIAFESLAVYALAAEPAWPEGPAGSIVGDNTLAALRSKETKIRLAGIDSLLSVTVPFSRDVQQRCIQRLLTLQGRYATSILFKTFSEIAPRVTRFGLVALTVSAIPATFLATEPGCLSAFIVFLTMLIFIYSLTLFTIQEPIRRRVLVQLAYRFNEGPKLFEDQASWEELLSRVGVMCETTEGNLAAMLEQFHLWGSVALRATRRATPRTAQELLRLVRSADIQDHERQAIFRWLCSSEIQTEGVDDSV